MKSDLATIDRVVNAELDRRHDRAKQSLTDADRKQAKAASTRYIAGLEVMDEEAEKAALDKMIADRRAEIASFRKARGIIEAAFAAVGVTPLAVVPTSVWAALCVRAGLFRMAPDASGRVGLARSAFDGFKALRPKDGGYAYEAETLAHDDWPSWLLRLMPNHSSWDSISGSGAFAATLVLPLPPADVAQTLVKASKAVVGGPAGVYHPGTDTVSIGPMPATLRVAAVAEAIRFKETPSQMFRQEMATRAAEEARAKALRNDPIVYAEHGGATAVLAQFGEFPIEQALVDAVVASDELIPRKPDKVQVTFGHAVFNPDSAYLSMLRQLEAEAKVRDSAFRQNAIGQGLIGLMNPGRLLG